MKVLVLNAGSSSVKYELFDLAGERSLRSGAVERVGEPGSGVTNHREAFARIEADLADGGISDADLDAIGHRVVHGGETFSAPVLIDDAVVEAIRALVPLAPLHNPPNLAGIEAARAQFPATPHVAVFDTAFHATMPAAARRYAIPDAVANAHGIRRYGFHGTSYAYVTRRAAEHLGRPVDETNLIAMHLGNGASICAIENGRSVDTSMGFTPLEGLVMGTRAGDIDAGAVLHLLREADMPVEDVDRLLNRESGLRGLCGDSDMRAICRRAAGGDPAASHAVELFCYRIRKYVGAYCAVLPRVDALVFTAGIGEHRAGIRARICGGLAHLGFEIDPSLNARPDDATGRIHSASSRQQILVVPTNEALEIARQCEDLLGARAPACPG